MDSAGRSVLSVNERAKGDPAGAAPVHDPLDEVMRYHQETKHHFSRFARAPGFLDWTNQPDTFRRYEGSPLSALPLLKPGGAPASPLYEDLYRSGAVASASLSTRSLRSEEHTSELQS